MSDGVIPKKYKELIALGVGFTTQCPFKGDASYWTLELDGKVHDGIVWSYEAPIPAAAGIAGLLSFYNDRVDLTVGNEASVSS